MSSRAYIVCKLTNRTTDGNRTKYHTYIEAGCPVVLDYLKYCHRFLFVFFHFRTRSPGCSQFLVTHVKHELIPLTNRKYHE